MFIQRQSGSRNYLIIAIVITLSATGCFGCAAGYGTDAGGVCQLCISMISQCTACSTHLVCSACNANYYLSPGLTSCLACSVSINNCLSCTSSSNCTGCLTGYYATSSTTCVPCDSSTTNCQYCAANGTCTQCVVTYYLSGLTCSSCTMTGCFNCTSPAVCVSCNVGYYLNAASTCISCPDTNCVSCSSASVCNQCTTEFTLNAAKSGCICQSGWVVTGYCTTVLGCTTVAKVNNVSTCLFCDSVNNFIISGTTCICKTGYKLSNKQCVVYCGDGLTVSPQTCDDGNTASGDGCSSSCQLQTNYKCSYDNSSVYKCVLTASFTVKLLYIQKTDAQNSCTYYLSISPSTPNFQKVNLTNYLTFRITQTNKYTQNSIAYSDGIISIGVSFTQDIQNMMAYLDLTFDPTYFNTTNFTTQFVSSGTNNPLIVSNYPAHLKYFKIGCYVMLGVAVVILIFSVAYQKMIAIETINILQLIFFTRLLYVQNDLIVSEQIFNLRYIMGYNDISSNWKQTHQTPITYRRLLFNTDFILNFQTGLLLMFLSIIIVIIMQVYKRKTLGTLRSNGRSDQYRLLQQKVSEKQRFVYERIVLLVACITLFSCIAAVRLQSRILNTQQHYTYFFLNISTMMFSVLYIFSILTHQVLNVGKTHTWVAPFCSYSPYYIGYYLCYILIITPILVSGEEFVGLQAIFVVSGVVLINTVIMAIWRPYKQPFHNLSNLLNNAVLLAVLGITATITITQRNQNLSLIFAYVLLGLFLAIQCLAIVRLCLACKPIPKQTQRLNRNSNQQDQATREFQMAQKEMMNNNKHSKSRHPISKAQLQQDQLIRLKNRLKMEYQQRNADQTYEL